MTSYTDLSIRDYLAGRALQGMLSHSTRYRPRAGASDNWHKAISEEAYELADAMLTERNSLTNNDPAAAEPRVPNNLEDAIWLVAEIIEQYEDKPPGPDDPPFEFQPEWVRNSYYLKAKATIVEAAGTMDDIGEKYHKVGRKR